MKSLLLIFAILVVAIIVAIGITIQHTASEEEINIKEIAWRLPDSLERDQIEKTFLISEIAPCLDFFVKKIAENQYVIACPKNNHWTYYNLHTDQKRVFLTDDDMLADLEEPYIEEEKSQSRQTEQFSAPAQSRAVQQAR